MHLKRQKFEKTEVSIVAGQQDHHGSGDFQRSFRIMLVMDHRDYHSDPPLLYNSRGMPKEY